MSTRLNASATGRHILALLVVATSVALTPIASHADERTTTTTVPDTITIQQGETASSIPSPMTANQADSRS